MLQEVIDFLHSAPAFFIATMDGPHPRVRPFTFVMEYNGLLCFATSNQKAVHRQLQANPHCEICALSPSGEWMRVEGKAMFLTDHRAKEKVFEVMPDLIPLYHDADNPVLQVFTLNEAKATVYGMTAEGVGAQRTIAM